jgi:hypothetical protein
MYGYSARTVRLLPELSNSPEMFIRQAQSMWFVMGD